jgi:hypothetical protein
MEQIGTEIVKWLGQLGLFGIASYWIQKSIDNSASKRLEEFKGTLNLMHSKQTSLHDKRLSVIESMYVKLVDLDYSMRTLTNPLKFDTANDTEVKLIQSSNEKFQDFNMYFERNKIYFSVKTCDVLNNIREQFYSALWDYDQPRFLKSMQVDDGTVLRQAYLKAHDVYEKVKDKFPVLRSDMEKEFREILNVN